jgi:hypothetical protein
MKHPQDLRLNRRQWMVAATAATAALAGCGGGGSSLIGTLPGTGGTGIGVQGPITGFGSVIVNSTRFDDAGASVYLDGVKLSSAALRVGMVASIDGALDTSGTSGSATRIDVWSIASGSVSQVDLAGAQFSMVGMRFSTDIATSFDGLPNLAALSVGTPVMVWGLQSSGDARAWRATRVKALSTSTATMVSTGLLMRSGTGTATLNCLELAGTAWMAFADQQLLRVEGDVDSAGRLVVRQALAMATEQRITSSGLIEFEGVVTAFTSATDFFMGAVRVDAGKAQVSGDGQSLMVGTSVEVTGALRNGVLIASKLELKGGGAAVQVDITGLVQTFNGLGSFEVRGQRCDASMAQLVSGPLSSLRSGTKVRVVGASEGHETLLVQSISIFPP